MTLITCPDCKTDVSDTAPACPRCGRPRLAPALKSSGLPAWAKPSQGAAIFLVLVGSCAALKMCKSEDHPPAAEPTAPHEASAQPPAELDSGAPIGAARPVRDVSDEVNIKGSPTALLLAALRDAGAWRTVVIDFNRLNKSDPDEMSFVLGDSWYGLSQGERRVTARKLHFLWAQANAEEQGSPAKCKIYLWTQDHEIAAYSDSDGDVVLKDLQHGGRQP